MLAGKLFFTADKKFIVLLPRVVFDDVRGNQLPTPGKYYLDHAAVYRSFQFLTVTSYWAVPPNRAGTSFTNPFGPSAINFTMFHAQRQNLVATSQCGQIGRFVNVSATFGSRVFGPNWVALKRFGPTQGD